MSRSSDRLVGWLAALAVLLIWSGWVVVSRLGVVQTLTIYDMAALRFTVAGLVVLPLARRYWPRALAWWQIALLSCGPGVPYVLFAFFGLGFAPASHAGILMNGTLPILAAVVGWLWLKEAPGRWKVAGMGIILCGSLLIGADRSSGGVGDDAWIGHLSFIATSVLLATYMVATKVWHVTPLQALVTLPLVNFAWYGPIYLLFLPKAIDRAGWPEILLQGLYQGLGPSILGVLCFTLAIRRIGATPTAAVLAGVPGMAALMAIPVMGEWPSLQAWVGLALATAGILLTAGWRPLRLVPRRA